MNSNAYYVVAGNGTHPQNETCYTSIGPNSGQQEKVGLRLNNLVIQNLYQRCDMVDVIVGGDSAVVVGKTAKWCLMCC